MNNILKNRRFTAIVLGLLLLGGSPLSASCQDVAAKKNDFVSQISEKRIDRYFQDIIRLSPRPPESEIFRKCRVYLANTLKSFSLKVWEEPFTANTPKGAVQMANVVAEKNGGSNDTSFIS